MDNVACAILSQGGLTFYSKCMFAAKNATQPYGVIIEMIKKTNSAQAPMMYNRLLFWQTDLQAAAALVQRKIDMPKGRMVNSFVLAIQQKMTEEKP